MTVSRKCAPNQRLAASAQQPLIVANAALTALGQPCFSLVRSTVTSGEIGSDAGAEGATAPETLRQTDRVTG